MNNGFPIAPEVSLPLELSWTINSKTKTEGTISKNDAFPIPGFFQLICCKTAEHVQLIRPRSSEVNLGLGLLGFDSFQQSEHRLTVLQDWMNDQQQQSNQTKISNEMHPPIPWYFFFCLLFMPHSNVQIIRRRRSEVTLGLRVLGFELLLQSEHYQAVVDSPTINVILATMAGFYAVVVFST